jgi:hypothetical protein
MGSRMAGNCGRVVDHLVGTFNEGKNTYLDLSTKVRTKGSRFGLGRGLTKWPNRC